MNICINKNDDDVTKEKVVRDDLGKIYRAYNQIYCHYRNLGHSLSSDVSLSVQLLFSMWNQEE